MSTTFQSILELDSYTKHPLKRNTIPPLPSTLDSTLPTSRIICGRGVGISCCAEMKIALIIHSPSKSLQVNLCWGGSFACFLIFPTQFHFTRFTTRHPAPPATYPSTTPIISERPSGRTEQASIFPLSSPEPSLRPCMSIDIIIYL